jgi:hypothetical protein
MKLNRTTIRWLILGFIWCIFMGITFISIGIGSLFPQLNNIAAPFVCPHGYMQVTEQGYTVSPVESGYILTYYCVDDQTGAKTELNPLTSINLVAGFFDGLMLFAVAILLWYFYNRLDQSPETQKWAGRMRTGIIIIIVGGLILLGSLPLFNVMTDSLAPKPTPETTATALESTYEALTQGQPVAFNSTETPLPDWKGIPIMPQATAGRQVNDHTYAFDVPEDSGTIESFYTDMLKSPGWKLEDSRWLGMKFTKDKRTLLVTLAPASDEQSWIVTLSLYP